MSASNQGPRPVGPPPPPPRQPPPGSPTPGGAMPPGGRPPGGAPGGWPGAGRPTDPRWGPGSSGGSGQAWMGTWTWSSGEGRFPWFAVLLLILGIGLLIELLVPDLTFFSLVILALGIAAAAAWLVRGVTWATMPALFLIAWGLADVLSDLGILTGAGWGTLFIGIALLIGWGLGRYQAVRRDWALVVGLVLGAIGLADVSDNLPFDVDFAIIIPLAMIGLGIYLILRNRLPGRQGA